jgi:putative membrane protein
MSDEPYARFHADNLILRDELAIDRTLLSNERTLLAYLRAGVALLIAGASIMHFSTAGWFWAAGLGCLPLGFVTGVIGVIRHRRMNRTITCVRRQTKTATMLADTADPLQH